jgi:rod shape-determining protein MreC
MLQGKTSPLSTTIGSLLALAQLAVNSTTASAHRSAEAIGGLPSLWVENQRLRDENHRLRSENAQLRESLSTLDVERRFAHAQAAHPAGIPARVIGYEPENALRVITVDRGWHARVKRNEGVIADEGIVGRVIEVSPFTSKILLITDYTSNIPAVVQRGRWWGIAKGTLSRVQLQYVSQDARLRRGDPVVTGEGRSFHAGVPIGKIVSVVRAEGGLYQTATVQPSVDFGRLDRVLILPK